MLRRRRTRIAIASAIAATLLLAAVAAAAEPASDVAPTFVPSSQPPTSVQPVAAVPPPPIEPPQSRAPGGAPALDVSVGDSMRLAAPPDVRAPTLDVDVGMHLGVFSGPPGEGGPVLGFTALGRWNVLAAGGLLEGGTALFSYSYSTEAAMAGLVWRNESRWRADLLGVLGAHQYSHIGAGLFSGDDPGGSATLGFAGVRAVVSYEFLPGNIHLTLGVWGFYEDDLSRRTVTYECGTTTGWLSSCGQPPHHPDVSAGASRIGGGLRFGGTFDVR